MARITQDAKSLKLEIASDNLVERKQYGIEANERSLIELVGRNLFEDVHSNAERCLGRRACTAGRRMNQLIIGL